MSLVTPIKQHKFTLQDKYQEFVSKGVDPKDDRSNSLNLFDNSNQKDGVLVRGARKFLSRKK